MFRDKHLVTLNQGYRDRSMNENLVYASQISLLTKYEIVFLYLECLVGHRKTRGKRGASVLDRHFEGKHHLISLIEEIQKTDKKTLLK